MLVRHHVPAAQGQFDPDVLRRAPLMVRLICKVLSAPRPYFIFVLLRAWGILRIGRFLIVSRQDDVREVLARDADFPPSFDKSLKRLDLDHRTFLLGLPDGPEYRFALRCTLDAFRLTDAPRVGRLAHDYAEAQLQSAAGGEIDAIEELLTGVLCHIVRAYYGIPADERFALKMFTISLAEFATAKLPAGIAQQVSIAMHDVSDTVLRAIQDARANPGADTVVARYVAMRPGGQPLDDALIRTTLTGMIAGFVPTNTLATANILEVLLDRPEAMAQAEAAARSGDDDLLGRCLLEASRLRPINYGPFRRAGIDTVLADGTPHATRVRRGDLVLAGTWMANLDSRRVPDPRRFDPSRPAAQNLGFGHGQHFCLGRQLAIAQMTQTFKPLLRRGNVRRAPGRAGRVSRYGPFAEHLRVRYNA
jgi:cytochrome P450